MGIERFVNNWDALKTDILRASAQPKPLTPFTWFDELVEGIKLRTQWMELPDLLDYANELLDKEHEHLKNLKKWENPIYGDTKPVHERVPSAAAYVLALFLGERELKERALQQFFGYNSSYAHDLAHTVDDEQGLYFTTRALAEQGKDHGRSWHTAVRRGYADVIKLIKFGDGEVKYIGMNLQTFDPAKQAWVLDTLGIKGPDKVTVLKYANPKPKAA